MPTKPALHRTLLEGTLQTEEKHKHPQEATEENYTRLRQLVAKELYKNSKIHKTNKAT